MARISSLNVLLTTSGKDYLAEKYGPVIANVQKRCISSVLKNQNLSGDPTTGTVEAKRFENMASQNYGTARAAAHGQYVKADPVVLQLSNDKEIVVEVEQKDASLYGVDGLIERQAPSIQKSMVRELERAFFSEAYTQGTEATIAGATIDAKMEELIQSVETVSNNFVDGVERDMIAIVCNPKTYGQMRSYFDKVEQGNATSESFGLFHGVRVYSSVYLPENCAAIAMAEGSVAQMVWVREYGAERVPLSSAIAIELFFSYGTKAVASDLIYKITDATTTTTGA